MPKYYEISEVAAKRAKDMNSYSDCINFRKSMHYNPFSYIRSEKAHCQYLTWYVRSA